MSIRRLVGLALVTTLFVPTAGHAFPSGAPYPGAGDYGSCGSSLELLSFCSHDEHAKGTTGALDVAVSLESRGQGYLPGTGNAFSQASFTIPFTLTEPAASVTVRAKYHVDEATMTLVRRYGGLAPGAGGYVLVGVTLSGQCFACYGVSNGATLIESSDPEAVSNEDVEVVTKITSCCEELLEGDFTALFSLEASAGLNPGFGSITSAARATLVETELTVQLPA
jgi:hypothetical protein